MENCLQQIAFLGLAQDLGLHAGIGTRQETFWGFSFLKKTENKKGGTVNLFLEISSSSDTASSIKVKIFTLADSFPNHLFLILSQLKFISIVLLGGSPCVSQLIDFCLSTFIRELIKNVLGLFFQVQLEHFF